VLPTFRKLRMMPLDGFSTANGLAFCSYTSGLADDGVAVACDVETVLHTVTEYGLR